MGLRALDEDLFALDVDRQAGPIRQRLRMVVVRLEDGGVLLCSPTPIDDAAAAAIDRLGPVRHLVAPNLNHHAHFAAARARYPDATRWGPAGLAAKKPGLGLERVLETGVTFGSGLVGRRIDGVPDNDEVVFFHAPSRTLICTDLVQHVLEEPSFVTRQLYRAIGAYGKLAQNRLWRARTEDRVASRAAIDEVLEWGFDRLVMAHGDVIESDGVARLRDATAWLR